MLELLQLHLDLSAPSSRHLHAKLKACETVEDAFKVLADNGWFISPSLANRIREDKRSKADIKAQKEAQEELNNKIEELKYEAQSVKQEIMEQGSKAQFSRNHEAVEDAF